jgi:hypothetical protein
MIMLIIIIILLPIDVNYSSKLLTSWSSLIYGTYKGYKSIYLHFVQLISLKKLCPFKSNDPLEPNLFSGFLLRI